MINELRIIAKIANEESFKLDGRRDTCIATSAALNYVLPTYGFSARPLRIRVAVHHPTDNRAAGVVLGSDGDGTRLSKAGKDMWHGHLAVLADEKYLLDATIDQVNQNDKWHKWIKITEPFVGEIPDGFLDGKSLISSHGNAHIGYSVSRKQNGFLSAPDWKFKSHWMPLANAIMRQL